MTTLLDDIDATQTLIAVTGSPPGEVGGLYTIGSESVQLLGVRTRPHRTLSDPDQWSVIRGVAGTTAATHTSGATLTRYYPDAAGGGGGGGVTVDPGDGTPVPVTGLVVPGAVIVGDEATLGKWTLSTTTAHADLSVSATTASDGTFDAVVTRTAAGTSSADAFADTIVTAADGDAHADTTVTVTGIQDANAKATATTVGGNADVSRTADVSGVDGSDAVANTSVSSAGDNGNAQANTSASASGDGNADILLAASVEGTGLATASVMTSRGASEAGMRTETDATSARLGFNGATPIAKPTGVAVTAEAIHAALVDLGLISA